MLVLPPNDPDIGPDQPVVFLAGPIKGARHWQSEAAEMLLTGVPSLVVASPRRDAFDTGPRVGYEEQVDWETRWLRRAGRSGAIVFWLARQTIDVPGRSYAQTTRFELGEWAARACHNPGVHLVVGIEDGFTGARYVRRRIGQDLPNVPIVDSLDAVVEHTLALVGARRLASLLDHEGGVALVKESLPEVLPWVRLLPLEAQDALLQELVEAAGAPASIEHASPIAQLLIEWEHTAAVYADPDLYAALTSPDGGDYGPVLPPDVPGAQ